jgi:hypothetical protein
MKKSKQEDVGVGIVDALIDDDAIVPVGSDWAGFPEDETKNKGSQKRAADDEDEEEEEEDDELDGFGDEDEE